MCQVGNMTHATSARNLRSMCLAPQPVHQRIQHATCTAQKAMGDNGMEGIRKCSIFVVTICTIYASLPQGADSELCHFSRAFASTSASRKVALLFVNSSGSLKHGMHRRESEMARMRTGYELRQPEPDSMLASARNYHSVAGLDCFENILLGRAFLRVRVWGVM